ncbi:AsmA family protein [Gammaproteobacteria bacterium LSUCC0057]|uniref:AsmA family protein n=1 Tax=Gammaproteobacteria bacterium LSUCC0057 TaxID=2559237 RepID=A0A4Y8UI81_9GAMM|nr:AsmA family protein [Gammaproteobacteria bacterium LSUCC0057]
MMGRLSKLLITVAVAVAVALAGLSVWVSQLNLAEQLSQAAAKQGLRLQVSGGVGWTLWPAPSIALRDIQFADQLQPQQANLRADIEQLRVAANWQQLISGEIALDTIAVHGAAISLQSFAALAALADTTTSPASSGPASSAAPPINIGTVLLVDSSISAPLAGRTHLITVDGELQLGQRRGDLRATATAQPLLDGQLSIALDWVTSAQAQLQLHSGRLDIGTLGGAQPLWLEQLNATVDAAATELLLKSLKGNLLGGDIVASGRADIGRERLTFSAQSRLQNLPLQPLLASQQSRLPLAGLINFNGNWRGSVPLTAQSTAPLLNSIAGSGTLDSTALVFTATNLERDFCSAATLLEGKSLSRQRATSATLSPQTQITALNANWTLQQGVLQLEQLAMASEALSLAGSGAVELAAERYVLRFDATIDSAAVNSTGCDISDKLADRPLPFSCTGSYGEPPNHRCNLDKRAVEQLLKTKLLETLQRKLEGNSSNNLAPLLDKLFK